MKIKLFYAKKAEPDWYKGSFARVLTEGQELGMIYEFCENNKVYFSKEVECEPGEVLGMRCKHKPQNIDYVFEYGEEISESNLPPVMNFLLKPFINR